MSVEKRNILLSGITERMAYKSSAHPVSKKYPVRQDYMSHAGYVKRQYNSVIRQSLDQRQVAAIKMKGTWLSSVRTALLYSQGFFQTAAARKSIQVGE